MHYQLPHTIENPIGEKLTFLEYIKEGNTDKLIVENRVPPGAGPLMHTHYLQEESLTVVSGRIGYQVLGQAPQFAEVGQTVVFAPGVAHKFWNAGTGELHCKGYVTPANTFIYFLSAIYAAQNKTGTERPELFDAAFLLRHYKTEYGMNDLPWFVRNVIMPVAYFIGKASGKYKHFSDVPPAIKQKRK